MPSQPITARIPAPGPTSTRALVTCFLLPACNETILGLPTTPTLSLIKCTKNQASQRNHQNAPNPSLGHVIYI